jgi:hypothetical protein
MRQDSARADGSSSSSNSSTPACSSSGRSAFSFTEIDAACEQFLDRRYGLQVRATWDTYFLWGGGGGRGGSRAGDQGQHRKAPEAVWAQ